MTLRQKQSLFMRMVARLIDRATEMGYELTFGEAYRPPETAELYAQQGRGVIGSLHCDRLAIDLNLFRDGHYLSSTEAHRPLGEWWEGQSTDQIICRWGGRFTKPDGNHYSLQHGSRA